jgi:HEAT repeat protein
MILYRGETSGGEIPDLLLSRLECESDNEVLSQLVLWFRYHHEDDRAIPGVCSLYGHPDHMVRTCVADVLGAYRDDQRATEVLTKLLLDVNPNVRAVAEEELAALN